MKSPDLRLLGMPSTIHQELQERVPALRTALKAVGAGLELWFPTTNTVFGYSRAEHTASSLASNDLLDLLHDLTTGRGRSAARSMRSIFEHLVTILDLTVDPSLGPRFLDHRALVEQTAAGLRFEVDALTGKERKAEEHRLRVLDRKSRVEAAAAVTTYGKDYRRGWSPGTLRDRATRHGLAADYEVYRLTSSVLHGSSGGALGTIRQSADTDTSVHRLGPAPSLCPLAFLRGLAYYRRLVEVLVSHNGQPEVARRAQPLLDALDEALRLWPDYHRATRSLDEELWASALPVSTLMSLVSLDRTGQADWWLWDLTTRRVARATPPADGAGARLDLKVCRSQLARFKEIYWQDRRHVNVVVTHLALSPAGPTWLDSEALIHEERPEIVYARGEPPFIVQKDSFAPNPLLPGLRPGGWGPLR